MRRGKATHTGGVAISLLHISSDTFQDTCPDILSDAENDFRRKYRTKEGKSKKVKGRSGKGAQNRFDGKKRIGH
jgi:hypothetical protein